MAPTNLQRDIRIQLSIKVVFTFVIIPANTLTAGSLARRVSYEKLDDNGDTTCRVFYLWLAIVNPSVLTQSTTNDMQGPSSFESRQQPNLTQCEVCIIKSFEFQAVPAGKPSRRVPNIYLCRAVAKPLQSSRDLSCIDAC